MQRNDRHPALWLALGALLLVASQMRFGLGVFAWIAPVPWLRYLRVTTGWKSRVGFGGALFAAWTLATLKIITAPLLPVFSVLFSLPMALALGLPFAGWAFVRRRLGEDAATLAFPALMVAGEWVLHGLLPFGTWGSAANTQVDQLALLQLGSVTGMHGVSFLVYASAVLERLLGDARASARKPAMVTATAVIGALAFGQARLTAASAETVPTRLVAAIGTDSTVGSEPDLPDAARLAADEQGLVRRTEQAARSGAELVVWNEAATMVHPEDEDAWIRRIQELATRLSIDLVAAYVVPLQVEPVFYENKYVFVRRDGTIDHAYFKHQPVPGESAVKGTDPMPRTTDAYGTLGGAICYDYDFPRIALANAGVDLVALPSSDWRGIDPIHTQMAALRAIENGHSIVRSTRFGLSAGIDPWGRIRGWLSAHDGDNRVLVVSLPQRGVTTIYGRLGDWFPLLCGLGGLGLLGFAMRSAIMRR